MYVYNFHLNSSHNSDSVSIVYKHLHIPCQKISFSKSRSCPAVVGVLYYTQLIICAFVTAVVLVLVIKRMYIVKLKESSNIIEVRGHVTQE